MSLGRLERLRQIVERKKKVLIMTHNNPDPDAIAAGWALRYLLRGKLGVGSVFVYGGIITRAENRAMVRLLNIRMNPLEMVNIYNFSVVALVETQPGSGNNSLPPSIKPAIVIDHHSPRKASQDAGFADIRPDYGSCSTILTEYLIEAGLPIRKKMATALFYGIKSDTQDLGRDATDADCQAMIHLYPKIHPRLLSQIENPDLSRNYFVLFDEALHDAVILGDVIFCDLGFLVNPEMVSLMADFLLRVSGVRWSLVIGAFDNRVIFSIRTKRHRQNAGLMARRIVKGLGTAGGHGMIAGGQVIIKGLGPEKQEKICKNLKNRFLKILGREGAKEEKLI
ncbi:MAG: bifunctional oligoribonuclease/PAP phosphatase NrnA [Deltaproteobacteria bacterium]|nr:bifunctional oligoribonuclease/PAP phosphatase NrnA [Deltaproteobacteria bacterium]MBW2121524.1 bifunctional oligoribonuclease/PAP phosphatase NrnA [Deltaproteobacteria bacterium]